ncbi:MAG: twin-arginine translocase TatA/TatE family subunit [Bdellovibrio sp.]|nr:MAG: twin-arginine translocase TatA/TatE family subunit [Bdellovibrio sp.]
MSPSIWQILIVLGILLLLFGPNRIPSLGRSLGEAIRGFKKGLNDEEIDVTDSAKKEEIPSSSSEQTSSEKKSEKENA